MDSHMPCKYITHFYIRHQNNRNKVITYAFDLLLWKDVAKRIVRSVFGLEGSWSY